MAKLPARARGVLSSVRPRLRFTEWAIVVVSLGVGAMGASSLVALHRGGDEARQAQLLVARIATSVESLEQVFPQAERRLGRRDRQRLAADERQIRASLAKLERLDSDDARLTRLRGLVAELGRRIDRTLAGGSPSWPHPVLQRTRGELARLGAHYDARAGRAVRITTFGSTVAVFATVVLVGLLTMLFARRRAARDRASEEERMRLIRLVQSVSASSNAATTLDEALGAALGQICAHTGWPLGHAYLLDEGGSGELASAGIWHVQGDGRRFDAFRAESERRRFAPGQGLPGRVLAERRPLWITAVESPASGMPRAGVAQQAGIRSAFAFPVSLNGRAVAVLEFFSAQAAEPDEPLLEAMSHVGLELGYLLQRKRAEAELRAAEARYRTLVEQLPLATYIDGPEGLGSTTYLSPQIEAMSGYTPDEFLADRQLFQKLLHPDDRGRVVAAIVAATAAGEPVEQEYRVVARDGRVRWWRDAAVAVRDERGNPAYRQGYVIDVTERREAEERLREAERRYRTLVEQLPLATYIDRLDETSSAIYMSPQIETILGYSPEEWIADKDLFPKLLHPEDRERVMAEVARTQATGDPFQCEYRLIARDGRVVWIRDEDVTIVGGDGTPLYAQGYMLDITGRKEVEQALEQSLTRERAANEHLRELDRLKDEFIALVSHELRTPLTSIRGYLEFLLEEPDRLAPEHARFLGIVERNAERLQHLVNDLLFVAQVDAGRLTIDHEEIDLPALAADAVDAARVVAEAGGIELRLDAEPFGRMVGDRARLAQLLDNLISNAIKFTREGGRVDVRVWSDDGRALVAIADAGIGIPEDEQAHLFERFYRASSATEQAIPGTGLGLAIAKAIVDAHGGAISVESTVGVGTTFTISLPLAAEVPDRRAAA